MKTTQRFHLPFWIIWLIIGLGLSGVLLIVGLWMKQQDGKPVKLILYAFSTQGEVLTQGILPEFEKSWEKETGQELEVESVIGPSVILASQINLGAPADIALFSNAHQVNWLKVGKKIKKDTQPVLYGHTPIVIVTRSGNPLQIKGYPDLASPGIRIIHPDPGSSGAGEWSILAEYGSALMSGNDATAAKKQLVDIWQNVRWLEPSARAALTLFEMGYGDVIITYEQDALLARDRGVPLEIVFPGHTILAEHYAVVIDENVGFGDQQVVNDFIEFLVSPNGQEILGYYHIRPLVEGFESFPELASSFRVDDLGGWTQAYQSVIATIWQDEIKPSLNIEPLPLTGDVDE